MSDGAAGDGCAPHRFSPRPRAPVAGSLSLRGRRDAETALGRGRYRSGCLSPRPVSLQPFRLSRNPAGSMHPRVPAPLYGRRQLAGLHHSLPAARWRSDRRPEQLVVVVPPIIRAVRRRRPVWRDPLFTNRYPGRQRHPAYAAPASHGVGRRSRAGSRAGHCTRQPGRREHPPVV